MSSKLRHRLSSTVSTKRTTLYGQLAYSDFEDKAVAEFFRGKGFENDSVTGVQVGINHKF